MLPTAAGSYRPGIHHLRAPIGEDAHVLGRSATSRVLWAALAAALLGACAGTASSAPTSSAPPPTTAPRSVTIVAAGDIIPYPSIVRRAAAHAGGVGYDFAPIFADLVPVVVPADLAICHLEVPIAPAGTAPSGYPDFAAPAEVVAGIAATGFDRCSTASNHSYDRGRRGIDATLATMDAAGVGHAGTARTPEEARPAVVSVRGVAVAHLAYTYGVNGTVPDEPWRIAFLDPARVVADTAEARAAGAELVVVSIHWGQEYVHEPTAEQRRIAQAITAAPGIDLVIGHHAHVLQPIEQVQGTWVAYGLGNLLANQGSKRPATYDGGLLRVTFTEGPDGRFAASRPVLVPTWVDARDLTIRRAIEARADPALAAVHGALAASLARTTAVIGSHVDW